MCWSIHFYNLESPFTEIPDAKMPRISGAKSNPDLCPPAASNHFDWRRLRVAVNQILHKGRLGLVRYFLLVERGSKKLNYIFRRDANCGLFCSKLHTIIVAESLIATACLSVHQTQ